MDPRAIQKLKDATVAIAILTPQNNEHPYEIVGTGFCIHPRGIIISCSHVLSAFFTKPIETTISEARSQHSGTEPIPLDIYWRFIPHAIFCCPSDSPRYINMAPVPFEVGINMLNQDLSVGRISNHSAFTAGYPTISIADSDTLYEGMEIGTCGFPLGNRLADQFGTITSSITKGILSAFIPAGNVQRQNVKAFQLNITATHGNSGGPVFDWETGNVFAVLSSGPLDHRKEVLPGLAKAMPVWKALENYSLQTILSLQKTQP